jgi:hypothetical protein
MNLLQKLFGGPSAKPEKRYFTYSVKCLRCGEVVEGRVDLDNDLSVEYEDGGDVFYARKGLMGDGKCFQRMEVEFKFSSNRELIEKQITGGEFI